MNDVIERAYSREFAYQMDGDDLPIISGLGVVFGEPALYGWFWKIIEDASFDVVLGDPALDCCGLFNHDANYLLARMQPSKGSKTLKMESGSFNGKKGVYYEFKAPNTTVGRDLAENVKLGNITGSSFAWITDTDDWSETYRGLPLQRVKVVGRVLDIGPVTYPAFAGTNVMAASRIDDREMAYMKERYEAFKNGAPLPVPALPMVSATEYLLKIAEAELDLDRNVL